MSRNAGAALYSLLTFPPFVLAWWAMSRWDLADGNDPLLLLIPIGFVAGIPLAIWQRRWLLQWARGVRGEWAAAPVFGLATGFFVFAVAHTINGAFADEVPHDLTLSRQGTPVAISLRRGFLGRDIVAGYRVLPDTSATDTSSVRLAAVKWCGDLRERDPLHRHAVGLTDREDPNWKKRRDSADIPVLAGARIAIVRDEAVCQKLAGVYARYVSKLLGQERAEKSVLVVSVGDMYMVDDLTPRAVGSPWRALLVDKSLAVVYSYGGDSVR